MDMKKPFYIVAVAFLALGVVSCKKDNINNGETGYGIDGRTPMPKAVDIGTVDKDGNPVLWASFNLGASKEYECGNYYAWGEKVQKIYYQWSTYIFSNGDAHKLLKYCTNTETGKGYWDMEAFPEGPDGIVTLEAIDDVASDKLGGKWRIPTKDDWLALKALRDNEDYEWSDWVSVPDDKGNEMFGKRITRKSTGATLFFPAAGDCLYSSIGRSVGTEGNYWSASIKTDGTYEAPQAAHCTIFRYNSFDIGYAGRFFGMSVRPVMTK